MATLAPSRAARTAMARPMPREPPVMNSVLPLSVLISLQHGRGAREALGLDAVEVAEHGGGDARVALAQPFEFLRAEAQQARGRERVDVGGAALAEEAGL